VNVEPSLNLASTPGGVKIDIDGKLIQVPTIKLSSAVGDVKIDADGKIIEVSRDGKIVNKDSKRAAEIFTDDKIYIIECEDGKDNNPIGPRRVSKDIFIEIWSGRGDKYRRIQRGVGEYMCSVKLLRAKDEGFHDTDVTYNLEDGIAKIGPPVPRSKVVGGGYVRVFAGTVHPSRY
jgi:hypothetical protein